MPSACVGSADALFPQKLFVKYCLVTGAKKRLFGRRVAKGEKRGKKAVFKGEKWGTIFVAEHFFIC